MKAVVFHGREDIRVDEMPAPRLQEPTDAIVRVTASGICGSDLHLYDRVVPLMRKGDILGHEAVGIVEEAGRQAGLQTGARVVVPFNISCGCCFMCERGLQSQCERTQVSRYRRGARLFGYSHLYGGVPGGQAERLRVPQAQYGPFPVPDGVEDTVAVLLADVLPTAWQAVAYADIPRGGTTAVWGLGPIGQMSARIARHVSDARVIGIDRVPARLEMARRHGIETIDLRSIRSGRRAVLEVTGGRGVDSGIDAVGTEAQSNPVGRALQRIKVRTDRFGALRDCTGSVRRGGTVSISGVYGGFIPLVYIGQLFDRQLSFRMGQANVRRWTDELIPLVTDPRDPLGTRDLVTHTLSLTQAPEAYRMFRNKEDGAVKVVLRP